MAVAGFAPYSRIEKVARKSIMATVRLNLTPEFAIRSSQVGCKARPNPDRTRNSAANFDLTKLWRGRKELRNLLVILGFDLRGRLRQLSRNLRLAELTRKSGAAPLSIRCVGRVWCDE